VTMDADLRAVKQIASGYGKDRSALIAVLQDVHGQFNYLPEGSLDVIARELGVPLASVYGVATFFRAFSFTPRGRHVASVCLGTACHVRGGAPVATEFERQLGIKVGELPRMLRNRPRGGHRRAIPRTGRCATRPIANRGT
jgi:NADH-quinone oxidoreductase subunit E